MGSKSLLYPSYCCFSSQNYPEERYRLKKWVNPSSQTLKILITGKEQLVFCCFDTCSRCFNLKWIHWTPDIKEISELQRLVRSNWGRSDRVRQQKRCFPLYLVPCMYCHYPVRKERMQGGMFCIRPAYPHSRKVFNKWQYVGVIYSFIYKQVMVYGSRISN